LDILVCKKICFLWYHNCFSTFYFWVWPIFELYLPH